MLSDISRLFDPLGLLGPLIITAKMFLQKLWILRIDWDDEVPLHLNREWEKFSSELSQLKNVNIDRHVVCSKVLKVDLIGFRRCFEKCIWLCWATPGSLSRSGVFPSKIQQLDIWWNGPSFLSSSSCPNFNDDPGVSDDEYLLEVKRTARNSELNNDPMINLSICNTPSFLQCILDISNNFSKIVRILSYVFRFVKNLKEAVSNRSTEC
ncbi:hypothetical protein HNY73_021423 [Argiope bruennichi]|uniref:Uncharacterized protein n=1 Tax=Argiope bruennichi TaxID=94029 RepID=A0A8T0E170_ARGBR|nr:hypothetical protein HNY73_021423 [Argiope bruennichi]